MATHHWSVFLLGAQSLHLLEAVEGDAATLGQLGRVLRDVLDVNQLFQTGRRVFE